MSLFIQVDSATVTFDGVQPLEALKDVSISIEKGEWVNIFGPSGSGKTTFLNVISGSIPLASGMVKVDGQNLSELKGTKLQEYRRNFIYNRREDSHFNEVKRSKWEMNRLNYIY